MGLAGIKTAYMHYIDATRAASEASWTWLGRYATRRRAGAAFPISDMMASRPSRFRLRSLSRPNDKPVDLPACEGAARTPL